MKRLILFLVIVYQKIRGLFPVQTCRFYPSCSEYMAESITKKGLLKGTGLGLLRILKCNPFHPGGYDPVEAEYGVGSKE